MARAPAIAHCGRLRRVKKRAQFIPKLQRRVSRRDQEHRADHDLAEASAPPAEPCPDCGLVLRALDELP